MIASVGDSVTCVVDNVLEPVQGVLRVSDLLEASGREGSLNPGEVFRLPLSIRGDRIGRHLCLFLFAYQSEMSTDGSTYRTLRQSSPLAVHPSLRISAFTRASGKQLDEFVLGLELENLHRDAVVELEHVSAVGRRWEMVTLNDDEKWVEGMQAWLPRRYLIQWQLQRSW